MDASEMYSKRLNAKELIFPKEKWKIHFSSRKWTNKIYWRRSGTENIHLNPGQILPRLIPLHRGGFRREVSHGPNGQRIQRRRQMESRVAKGAFLGR